MKLKPEREKTQSRFYEALRRPRVEVVAGGPGTPHPIRAHSERSAPRTRVHSRCG